MNLHKVCEYITCILLIIVLPFSVIAFIKIRKGYDIILDCSKSFKEMKEKVNRLEKERERHHNMLEWLFDPANGICPKLEEKK